jgi:HSP20 family molecular chaperone IbpA
MDLHENAETNTVTATFELPGLSKSDVQLDVHNGRLTVAGESKASSEYEQGGYAVQERRFGKFARVLQLPEGVKVAFLFLFVFGWWADCNLSIRRRKSRPQWRMEC